MRLAHQSPDLEVGLVLPLGPHQVLRVHDADDVVDPLLVHGDTAVSGGDGDLDHVADPVAALHGDHVGTRDHDLPHHSVAELDDRMDEGSLLSLDHVLFHGHIGHGQELLLRDEGCGDALPRQDEVGQPDQGTRDETERGEPDDGVDERRREQGGPIGVLDGPCLGGGLEEHEDHHDLEGGRSRHPQGAEGVVGHHAHQGGGDELAEKDQQEDGVEEPLGVLDQLEQSRRSTVSFVGQGQCLGPAHAQQSRLGQSQRPHHHQQDDDDHHQGEVTAAQPGRQQARARDRRAEPGGRVRDGRRAHASGALTGSPPRSPRRRWNRSSSSCSRCSMAVASSSSTWSIPVRCRMPWTRSRASSSS